MRYLHSLAPLDLLIIQLFQLLLIVQEVFWHNEILPHIFIEFGRNRQSLIDTDVVGAGF